MCAAGHSVVASMDVPLLRNAELRLSSLKILVEDPVIKVIPQLLLGMSCVYEDQLGGPVFYEEVPQELVCTDSTGKNLKVYMGSSDATKVFGVGHGDPVCLSIVMQCPDPGAEWVHLRGFFLCAFADDLVELPVVILPLLEDGTRVELPLKRPGNDKVSLTLKKGLKYWSLRVEGRRDFYFNSMSVREENGLPLKGRGHWSSWGGKSRAWGKDYLVPSRCRSLRVAISYWNKRMLRKVPVDMKISLGGAVAPGR